MKKMSFIETMAELEASEEMKLRNEYSKFEVFKSLLDDGVNPFILEEIRENMELTIEELVPHVEDAIVFKRILCDKAKDDQHYLMAPGNRKVASYKVHC